MNPSHPSNALHHEIAGLRRELQRQRWFTLAVAVGAVTLACASRVTSQPAPVTEMTLKTLRIMGPDGRVRVLLSGDPVLNSAGGSVALFDTEGHVRLGLMGAAGGGSVAIIRDDSEPAAMFGADAQGGMFTLSNNSGKGKLTLAAVRGGVGLKLVSNDARSVVSLAADTPNCGLYVKGDSGRISCVAGSNKTGGVLALYDRMGHVKRHLP